MHGIFQDDRLNVKSIHIDNHGKLSILKQKVFQNLKLAMFELVKPYINLPPYHYGIVGQKKQF